MRSLGDVGPHFEDVHDVIATYGSLRKQVRSKCGARFERYVTLIKAVALCAARTLGKTFRRHCVNRQTAKVARNLQCGIAHRSVAIVSRYVK